MKKVAAILAIVASVPLLTLGILFLVAAVSRPERFLVAAILLAAGSGLLAAGITIMRRAAETAPEALANGAIALARRSGGEVTAEQLQAEYRISLTQAQEVLAGLQARGQATPEQRSGRVVYVVAGLQPSLVVRRCPHCGSTFPVRQALYKCPHCGGDLDIAKT
mgnify:FL=1